jgi:hypothetical protein
MNVNKDTVSAFTVYCSVCVCVCVWTRLHAKCSGMWCVKADCHTQGDVAAKFW